MKKILLPTDFSECARHAMKYAVNYFGEQKVQYILLNTFKEPPTGAGMLVSITDMLHKDSKVGLAEEAHYLEDLIPYGSPDIVTISEYGDLSVVIKEESKNRLVDHVFMGTKGSEGLDKFFSGSHAANVIRSTTCPLWIIPMDVNFENIHTIGFASDYDKLKNKEALIPLRQLVHESENELIIVNIQKDERDLDMDQSGQRLQLAQIFEDIPHFVYNGVHHDVVEGINNFIYDYKVDLLTMVARKHGLFESIFRRSVSKDMAMLIDIPLLVLSE